MPTIADVEIGRFYTPSFAAKIFGRSNQWATIRCRKGWFPNATRLEGTSNWLIPGADIRLRYGEKQIERDRRAAAAEVPTPAALDRERKRELEEFWAEQAKGKKKGRR